MALALVVTLVLGLVLGAILAPWLELTWWRVRRWRPRRRRPVPISRRCRYTDPRRGRCLHDAPHLGVDHMLPADLGLPAS